MKINNATIKGIKRMVQLELQKGGISYLIMEDKYTDDPEMYFSRGDRLIGGGKRIFGELIDERYLIEKVYDDDDKAYSLDGYCKRIYEYIQETYN